MAAIVVVARFGLELAISYGCVRATLETLKLSLTAPMPALITR